jgi:HEPN domain-containing protein
MMTKEEHIKHWVKGAQYDWTGAEDAFNTEHYVHCLFWAHLTMEKLSKAHWVKNHQDNIPPRIHNVVWLLGQSNIDLGEETMKFLEDFIDFQLSGRYPDYTQKIYKICTKEYTYKQLKKIEEVRQCLLKML